jgi:hypothetical protein
MTEDEQLVRDNWHGVRYENGRVYAAHYHPKAEWILSCNSNQRENRNRLSESNCWKVAADFTRRRLKIIHEVEEEIEWVKFAISSSWISDVSSDFFEPIRARVLTGKEAELAELKLGMKEANILPQVAAPIPASEPIPQADGGGPFDRAVERLIAHVDAHLKTAL